ncbi:MAG: hypothetical protein AAFR57_01230 [Pseudomonadota bacterium]
MSDDRRVNVSLGTFSCVIEGYDDPAPILAAITAHFEALQARNPSFGTRPMLADKDALQAELGTDAKVSGPSGKPVVRRQEVQVTTSAPAAQKPLVLKPQLKDPASMPLPEADPTLFNPYAAMPALGKVSGEKPTQAPADEFEWTSTVSPPPEPEAPPAPVDPEVAFPTPAGFERMPVPPNPDGLVSSALEQAMTAPARNAVSSAPRPAAKLSLPDYAAPRRVRHAEDAVEIVAAYTHYILGEEEFEAASLIRGLDDVPGRKGIFPPEDREGALQALIEGGAILQQPDGLLRLSDTLLRKFRL